ncbi:MAG: hypothetical protein K8S15_13280 [Candidatus Aegiribacteria sp.]|nr:hypothetical protein [Candidatus Aegiribacteria sp.]
MKLVRCIVVFSGFSILLAGCDAAVSDDEYVDDFSLLDGNCFVMEVDRVLGIPNEQLPMDGLQENDYIKTNEDIQYDIVFSEDGQTVTIEPGSINGQETDDGSESINYNLDVFAGGRFVVWINSGSFEAELTIYGSGVPIVKSERGYLSPFEK